MTSQELKTINRLLQKVNDDLEAEALSSRVDLLSKEFIDAQENARDQILQKYGFTLKDYLKAKASIGEFSQEDLAVAIGEVKELKDDIRDLPIPTEEGIAKIAYEIAKQFIKPPQITNQIVKETTIEKPQIIKETRVEKVVEEKAYNEKPLQEKIAEVSRKVDGIQPVDIAKLKEDMAFDFGAMFQKNIDILGMPNFRKLAMGLQAQIDEMSVSGANAISGTVNGTNQTFTFAKPPMVLVADGSRVMMKNNSDGTANWTGSNPVVLTIAPNFDLFVLL